MKCEARLSYTYHLAMVRFLFNILSTIDSEGEGRVSVARHQSFGRVARAIVFQNNKR